MMVVAYKINEQFVGNYEQEKGFGCSGIILIFLTILFTIGNVTWTVYQYIWFKDCSSSVTMMIVTTIVNILFYGLVFLRAREDASIFTSSVVVFYVLYLQWSALASSPDQECNPFFETNVNTTLQIVGGLFFTMISLVVISSSSKSGEETNLTTKVNGHLIEHDEEH